MKNTFKVLGIVALVAAIGFSFAACSGDDGGYSNVDPALNGTWVSGWRVFKFNNGDWEFRVNGGREPNTKGTYTTSSGNIELITTHLAGLLLPNYLGGTAEYYTKAEIKALYEAKGAYDTVVAQWLDKEFAPETDKYSISGKTLTWIWSSGDTEIFTK
jgi:hypothetical protein